MRHASSRPRLVDAVARSMRHWLCDTTMCPVVELFYSQRDNRVDGVALPRSHCHGPPRPLMSLKRWTEKWKVTGSKTHPWRDDQGDGALARSPCR